MTDRQTDRNCLSVEEQKEMWRKRVAVIQSGQMSLRFTSSFSKSGVCVCSVFVHVKKEKCFGRRRREGEEKDWMKEHGGWRAAKDGSSVEVVYAND